MSKVTRGVIFTAVVMITAIVGCPSATAASVEVNVRSSLGTGHTNHTITLNGRVLPATHNYFGDCWSIGTPPPVPLEIDVVYTCYIDTRDGVGWCGADSDPAIISIETTSSCTETYINGVLGSQYAHWKWIYHDSFQVEVRAKKVLFTWNCPKENGRYALPADGHSQALPSQVDTSVGSLTWSFVGADLGCRIDSSSGRITAGTNTGTIKVRAESGITCYEESLDLVDCTTGCNGADCGRIGAASAATGSVDVRMPLGWSMLGNDAGYLHIKEGQPSDTLATPAKLKYRFARADVEQILDGSGNIKQLKASDGLAFVVVSNSSKYRVEFYSLTNVVDKTNGVYKLVNTPFTTVTVENPSGDTNKLRITQTRDGSDTVFDYTWTSTNVLELVSGNGLRKETQTTERSGAIRTVTTTVQEGSNPVVFRKQQKYETGSYTGERLTQEITGSGSYPLTNSYTYTANGFLQQLIRSDGSWEYYVYDSADRPTNIFSSFKNQGVTTDRTLCRLREMVYSTNAIAGAGDHGNLETNSPRQTIEFLLGQEIARSYFVALPGERRQIQSVTAGASWSNANNLVTITKVFTNTFLYNEPKSILRPDGTIDIFQYGTVITNGTNIVLTGHPSDSYATNVDDGTKTLLIYDSTGSLLSRTTIDILSGLTIAAETNKYDGLKRLTNTVFLDGTSVNRSYDCCTVNAETERDGTVVSYTYAQASPLRTSMMPTIRFFKPSALGPTEPRSRT